jgi:hypothetical protein
VAESKARLRIGWTAAVAATYLLLVVRVGGEARPVLAPDVACIDGHGMESRLPGALGTRVGAFEDRWPCPARPLDAGALRAAIGDAPFAAPYPLPEVVEEQLPWLPNFVPSYWSGTINLWDEATEQRKVTELRQVQWALLAGPPVATAVDPNVKARFSIATHFRAVHSMTWDGVLADEMARNWTPAGRVGSYVVYRRIR